MSNPRPKADDESRGGQEQERNASAKTVTLDEQAKLDEDDELKFGDEKSDDDRNKDEIKETFKKALVDDKSDKKDERKRRNGYGSKRYQPRKNGLTKSSSYDSNSSKQNDRGVRNSKNFNRNNSTRNFNPSGNEDAVVNGRRSMRGLYKVDGMRQWSSESDDVRQGNSKRGKRGGRNQSEPVKKGHKNNRTRGRSDDRSRDRNGRRGRNGSKGQSRSCSRSGSRGRGRSGSRGRDRSGGKERDRSNSRDRSRGRGRSGSRGRDRSRSRNRDRGGSRDRGREDGRGAAPSEGLDIRGYQYNDDNEEFTPIDENGDWDDNSEIPILYNSEEEDGYQDQRPNTVNERRRYPEYRRYEGDNDQVRVNYRDPAHRKVGRTTGALVRLFRNGDTDHRGCPLTINQKFKNFESLLQVLNDKIPTPTGIKHIFKWPEGREMKSVTDFQNRCVYIVSSTRTLRRDVNYGESREGYWSNKRPSAGKVRTQEVQLFKRPTSPKGSPKPSPFIVTIVHNLHRDRREKVILNPHTSQSFEEWLEDINNQDIPVRALYMDKAPFTQIRSFSHLFRELRNKTSFLACGDEYVPVELAKKRQAPGSNSSTESFQEQQQQRTGGPGGGRKKPQRHQDMDQIYENGRPDSPSTNTSMSRYDTGPLGGGGGPRGQAPALRPPPPPIDNRRGPRGAVHVEIDGVVREFWPPSYTDSEDDGTRPNQMLKCQWVYGFRGRDARHNLAVLPGSGELVYYVASIAVLYDKVKDVQRHYNKHNEEISCLTLHPNGYLIATGQLHGKEPEHSSHIRIWDSESLSTYSVIGLGVFYGGIISIGFSYQGTGNLMCALDGSSKHVLSVWRVSLDEKNRGDDSNYIIARTSTSTDPVHCACFYPADENNSILITYGAKHIYFWKIFFDATKKKEAKIFRDRCSGIFEEHCPKSVNCVAFLSNGDVVTGDSSGNLMVWDRDAGDAFTCKFVVNAHQGPIMSVVALKDGTILSGGGSEIKGWDSTQNFVCTSTRQMPSEVGGVRSIVTLKPGGEDGNMYIGTTRSCILEGAMGDKFNVLIQGHSDAIWGLVAHPYEPTFITAGSDAVVYKWSVVTHRVYWRSQIEAPCTSLAVDHHNELVALGTSEGTFVILNAFNGMHIATVQVGTETISCLAFSPNGMYLATGCNDGLITIFNVHDRGHTYVKASVSLRGHGSGVGHLDWSRDNNSLQSVANDNELIFWDLLNMKQNKTPMKTRDIEWFTNTCNVSYSLIGPWTNLDRNEQVKVVNRSRDRALVLVGDTVGRLRLYKYPCSRERADFRNVRVYSSEVTAVAFTPDSRTALTCGGRDAALMQWTVDEEL